MNSRRVSNLGMWRSNHLTEFLATTGNRISWLSKALRISIPWRVNLYSRNARCVYNSSWICHNAISSTLVVGKSPASPPSWYLQARSYSTDMLHPVPRHELRVCWIVPYHLLQLTRVWLELSQAPVLYTRSPKLSLPGCYVIDKPFPIKRNSAVYNSRSRWPKCNLGEYMPKTAHLIDCRSIALMTSVLPMDETLLVAVPSPTSITGARPHDPIPPMTTRLKPLDSCWIANPARMISGQGDSLRGSRHHMSTLNRSGQGPLGRLGFLILLLTIVNIKSREASLFPLRQIYS